MDLGLRDRRALVAAASKGLGRACAEALVSEGAKVFISSRDAAAIESTGKSIKATGWAPADVSKPGEPESLRRLTLRSVRVVCEFDRQPRKETRPQSRMCVTDHVERTV